MEQMKKNLSSLPLSQLLILSSIFLGLVVLLSYTLPTAPDWHNHFRPATQALIQGKNPFDNKLYLNAPWTLIPMIPLLLVSEQVGRAILAIMALASLAFVGYRLGAKPLAIIFILLSPPVFQLMLDGNIDWLMALGFVLPPHIGLIFLAIKPQTGFVVALLWFYQAWKKNGWREVVRISTPVTILFLISFLLYGLWPLNFSIVNEWKGNASLWPSSIPVGLALLATALRREKIEYAMAASPCLSPYVLLHSWIGPLLAISASTIETICAVIGLWILVLIRAPV
ncbi:MAG: hypothetical protein GX577_00200 [Leptolinea sp.]|nr:hypothetical protein [Leptolinea sp.]